MPWENWQPWHTYTLVLLGIVAALFATAYIAERCAIRFAQKEAERTKRPARKPTSREFLVSLEIRRTELGNNVFQMSRRYEKLQAEISSISSAEEGASKLLVEKIHERAELGAEIAKVKNEVYKLGKFIREIREHYAGKPERNMGTSN